MACAPWPWWSEKAMMITNTGFLKGLSTIVGYLWLILVTVFNWDELKELCLWYHEVQWFAF